MSKVAFLKSRNGAQRERYAQNQYLRGIAATVYAKNPYRIIRADLKTTVETEITKREFESEWRFNCKFHFSKIVRVALYTDEYALIWRDMQEKKAIFYTSEFSYRVEYLNDCSNNC